MTDGLRGLVSILGESRFVGRGNRSQRCNALKTSRLTVRSYFLLIPPSYLYITYSVVQTSNTSNLAFCLNLTNFLHFPNRPLYNRKPETHRISKVRNELTRAPLKRLLPKRNSRSSIATTSPLLSISNVPLINRIESANGRHSSAPTCTVPWFSLSMLKKPWPHFNGGTVVISTITRYYAIVRNSRHRSHRVSVVKFHYPPRGTLTRTSDIRGIVYEEKSSVGNISHLRCRVQPPRLIEIQRCIRVACAPLVFRLNGQKWICLSFRTRRVVEIRRNVTSPRRRNGKDG